MIWRLMVAVMLSGCAFAGRPDDWAWLLLLAFVGVGLVCMFVALMTSFEGGGVPISMREPKSYPPMPPPRPAGAVLSTPHRLTAEQIDALRKACLYPPRRNPIASPAPAKLLSNCPNCGAPHEPVRCSFCLTPSPDAPAAQLIDVRTMEDSGPRYVDGGFVTMLHAGEAVVPCRPPQPYEVKRPKGTPRP